MAQNELPALPTEGPIYVIGYARVSGKRQYTDGHSIDAQKKEIRAYCAERGWILLGIVVEVFSGWYLIERRKLAKLREDYIKTERVHVLLVWKLDRLSRDNDHATLLAYECAQHHVRIESCTEKFDDTPVGVLIRQVYAFSSSLERTKIIERVKSGQLLRSDEGLLFGGGVPRYGWMWGDKGNKKKAVWLHNPQTMPVVKRIYEMYVIENLSYRKIAARLNEEKIKAPRGGGWTAPMVANIIKDPKYKGEAYNRTVQWKYINGKKKKLVHPDPTPVAEGVIPPIVSADLWEKAQEKRRHAKTESIRRNKQPKPALLRAGYARCGYCGAVMTAETHHSHERNGDYSVSVLYGCNSRRDVYKDPCMKRPQIGAVGLDNEVWKFLGEVLDHFEEFKEALQLPLSNAQESIAAYDDLIRIATEGQMQLMQDLKQAKAERTRALILANIDTLSEAIAGYEQKREALVPASEEALHLQQEVDAFLEWCSNLKGRFDEATYEEKRVALRMLGVEVRIWKKGDPDYQRWQIKLKPEILEKLTSLAPELEEEEEGEEKDSEVAPEADAIVSISIRAS